MAIANDNPKIMGMAVKAVSDGMPLVDFQRSAMKELYNSKTVDIPKESFIGLKDKEVRQFSVTRAINALSQNDRNLAPFEFECSDAACKQRKKDTEGICIPYDVLTRDLTAGSATDGGNLIATNLLTSSFIDLLRNSMVLQQAGMQTLNGLVGNIAIPKQTGGAAAYWVNENGAPTESSPKFGQVAMTPKTVGARTELSRKLIIQSSLDIEAFVRNELVLTLALELDRVGLNGSGVSPVPLGLLQNSDVKTVSLGTSGAAPTFAKMVELETEVADQNAMIGNMSYITNARSCGKLKTTEITANTGKMLLENWQMNGYKVYRTNQIPKDLTKGTGSNLSAMIFGVFSNLIMGTWSGLDLLVDPYSNGDSGALKIRVLQDVDLLCRYPESFAKIVDLKTT